MSEVEFIGAWIGPGRREGFASTRDGTGGAYIDVDVHDKAEAQPDARSSAANVSGCIMHAYRIVHTTLKDLKHRHISSV